MKTISVVVLSLLAVVLSHAQQNAITTVILVRHAEKTSDGTADPPLSPEGLARAEKLALMLQATDISALFATPWKRTRHTLAPLAEKRAMNVGIYSPDDMEAVDRMLAENAGSTIVVCGHSNTIPRIANHLLGRPDFTDFDERDYGNILVVSVSGAGGSKAVRLRY